MSKGLTRLERELERGTLETTRFDHSYGYAHPDKGKLKTLPYLSKGKDNEEQKRKRQTVINFYT